MGRMVLTIQLEKGKSLTFFGGVYNKDINPYSVGDLSEISEGRFWDGLLQEYIFLIICFDFRKKNFRNDIICHRGLL